MVYKLTPGTGGAWTETILYSFKGGADGAYPGAGLTLGPGAVLYGTTAAGGSTGNGTVFLLTPPKTGTAWGEQVLYSFGGAPDACGTIGQPACDGANPAGGVVVGKAGVLFGTTFNGGFAIVNKQPISAGTVFQLTPPTGGAGPWTESIIYTFKGGADGGNPEGGLTNNNGLLLGATCCGTEGVIFEVHQSGSKWIKSNLFSFAGYPLGAFPNGLIESGGVIYGTTQAGGKGGAGIVFSLTKPTTTGKPWTLTTIHAYTGGTDGGSPYAGLTLGPGGVLYGTVTVGCANGVGGVVQFTPPTGTGQPWTETILYNFTGLADGGQPDAGLILGAGSALYGTTVFGGASGYGTVFKLVP
jgi:uncharacterized repeat protein (TIGR03803 family)